MGTVVQFEELQVDIKLETATLGAGCFWCVEAVFEQLRGVSNVKSGYCAGSVPDPTYEQVCTGKTGHAEVIQFKYDPEEITFGQLLDVFFVVHDPTTLNRQGADIGTQYRSAIYTHSDSQQQEALAFIQQLDASGDYPAAIVTEVVPAATFYIAENYHQEYFRLQGERNSYCRVVVAPKVTKFRQKFLSLLSTKYQ